MIPDKELVGHCEDVALLVILLAAEGAADDG